MVTFREKASISALIGFGVGTVVVLAALFAGFAAESGSADRAPIIVIAAVFVVVVLGMVLAMLLRTSPAHTWNLTDHTITFRGQTYQFSDIGRVVLCSGARGWRGLLFCTIDGRRIRNMAVNLQGSMKESMGRDHWVAVRALLAAPHAPNFEGYGAVTWGPGDIERKLPRIAVRGREAVALVDAQIAWIDAGNPPNSRQCPVEQFRRRR